MFQKSLVVCFLIKNTRPFNYEYEPSSSNILKNNSSQNGKQPFKGALLNNCFTASVKSQPIKKNAHRNFTAFFGLDVLIKTVLKDTMKTFDYFKNK